MSTLFILEFFQIFQIMRTEKKFFKSEKKNFLKSPADVI